VLGDLSQVAGAVGVGDDEFFTTEAGDGGRGRASQAKRAADRDQSLSPAEWPWVSLMPLKLSKSINATPTKRGPSRGRSNSAYVDW
jgi:hypothetical protein